MTSPWRDRVLGYLDDHAHQLVTELSDCVRLPSISGSDEENAIQAGLAVDLAAMGLEVDHWQIPLAKTVAAEDFPGVEVDRREAWGLVGRRPGASAAEGPSLMLNVHVDVVPPGDPGRVGGRPVRGHG